MKFKLLFMIVFNYFLVFCLQTMFRPSAQCIIRERIAMGVFDVVVAPRGNAKTVVVVPKTHSEEWRGYAFAEQVTRCYPSPFSRAEWCSFTRSATTAKAAAAAGTSGDAVVALGCCMNHCVLLFVACCLLLHRTARVWGIIDCP